MAGGDGTPCPRAFEELGFKNYRVISDSEVLDRIRCGINSLFMSSRRHMLQSSNLRANRHFMQATRRSSCLTNIWHRCVVVGYPIRSKPSRGTLTQVSHPAPCWDSAQMRSRTIEYVNRRQ